MYILVVDDDQFENTLVQFVLSKEGYEVETSDNPRGALQMIKKREPDLLIIDVMMPYLNGFDFAIQLRKEGYAIPIMFMTAQDTIESKLQGFNIGADDYICKPFNHQELVARVQAVIRRVKHNANLGNSSICNGQFELFPGEMKVIIADNVSITLTPTEMHVLRVLMSSTGQVVERDHDGDGPTGRRAVARAVEHVETTGAAGQEVRVPGEVELQRAEPPGAAEGELHALDPRHRAGEQPVDHARGAGPRLPQRRDVDADPDHAAAS